MVQYIERPLSAVPVRGLIRRAAIRQAGLVRSDEFRAAFRYLSGWPSSCAGAISSELPNRSITDLITPTVLPTSTSARRRIGNEPSRTTLFTGLLEAAMPLCRTPEERLFFQQAILDQIVAYPANEERAQLRRKAHGRMSRAPEIRGEYTPAQRRRTSPGPPRITTSTGRVSQAVPNAENYLSNPPAVPNGETYLSKVPNAESYLSNPPPTRDVGKMSRLFLPK